MKLRALRSTTLALCTLLLLGAPLLGQERHRHGMEGDSSRMGESGMMGMMGRQGMMGHGSMMGMSPATMMTRPGALLGLGETLGLSENQEARLKELQATARESHKAHMQAAHEAHQRAREMLDGDSPDVDAYTETLQSAMTHMAQAHASMVRASVEARGVLTDEQEAQLDSAARIMKTMHRMRQKHRGMPMQKEGGMD